MKNTIVLTIGIFCAHLTGIMSAARADDLRPIPVNEATCFGKLSTETVPSYPGSGEPDQQVVICQGSKSVCDGKEVLSLLVNPYYKAMVEKAAKEAQLEQRVLVLDGYSLQWSGVVETVIAHFSTRSSIDSQAPKTELGIVQGQLMLDSSDNFVTVAISNTFYDGHGGQPGSL